MFCHPADPRGFPDGILYGPPDLHGLFGTTRTRAAGAANENGPVITIPLILLAILAFLGGALNLPGVATLGIWLEHTIPAVHAGSV